MDGSGRYYHGINGIGSAGEAGPDLVHRIIKMAEGFSVGGEFPRFQEKRFFAGPCQYEVYFYVLNSIQPLQQPKTVNCAARTGDTDNNSHRVTTPVFGAENCRRTGVFRIWNKIGNFDILPAPPGGQAA